MHSDLVRFQRGLADLISGLLLRRCDLRVSTVIHPYSVCVPLIDRLASRSLGLQRPSHFHLPHHLWLDALRLLEISTRKNRFERGIRACQSGRADKQGGRCV